MDVFALREKVIATCGAMITAIETGKPWHGHGER